MQNKLRLLVIAGARPNFMKVAPLLRTARNGSTPPAAGHAFECRLVHTGQHYDAAMSDIFFNELGIAPPDITLDARSGSHAAQTARIMERFDPVVVEEKPDWVVVVGDVNSTLACTLVCAKRGIKVAHIEAGLRSFDRTMPEEVNRIVTDALADLLLTPSTDADENLRREGIAEGKIRCVGNIMIDSLCANLDRARSGSILKDLKLQPRKFVYVTLHRPANVDDLEKLRQIMHELSHVAQQLTVVFPVHPRTRNMLQELKLTSLPPSLKLIHPIGYHDSLLLAEHARYVLTDSGGLQEETTYFRTPCLTLRPNTERPVTISLGSNRLTSLETLGDDIEAAFNLPERCGEVPPLWDGRTAERCLEAISAAS